MAYPPKQHGQQGQDPLLSGLLSQPQQQPQQPQGPQTGDWGGGNNWWQGRASANQGGITGGIGAQYNPIKPTTGYGTYGPNMGDDDDATTKQPPQGDGGGGGNNIDTQGLNQERIRQKNMEHWQWKLQMAMRSLQTAQAQQNQSKIQQAQSLVSKARMELSFLGGA